MTERKPQRVLVISWSSSEDLLPIAFDILSDNHLLEGTYNERPELKLLVKQKWATHQNKLPITIIRLGKKVQAYSASAPVGNKVNSDVARVHNANGVNSFPPFVTDYTIEPPYYSNPRDPSLLTTGSTDFPSREYIGVYRRINLTL
ncbi:uncharacterized protein BO80DRAFT_498110 [Aspergillus ibericus CBS 121593]|uniref:Uncharacterized protein n=1 Tax=Aspergillus ibericus CBS 121593 TaxID=1448316 RepID=A0A395GLP5_9EURO|nr:hypothetical protein BO80DRAFT_498110 [Aspergillus ibericus CBS 121593]RAK94943.1 hypothetical protein BO80DRAFT_498110 [Aspergillus ibericus CBS 121593]